MHFRSWMAAAGLVTGSLVLLSGMARSQKSGADQSPPVTANPVAGVPKTPAGQKSVDPPKRPANNGQNVKLTIMIAGLGQDGCDLEVKPGNQSTRFKPQRLHVEPKGEAKFEFQDIELRGADRNCTFAITVNEPGQNSRTIYRGFRIAPKLANNPPAQSAQSFTCFMNSPSKLAGMEPNTQIRR